MSFRGPAATRASARDELPNVGLRSTFTEQALELHHAADRIAVAARERDRGRVLTELGATLQTCTSCHAAWKQQVVDEPTWQRLTASSPPTHVGPH